MNILRVIERGSKEPENKFVLWLDTRVDFKNVFRHCNNDIWEEINGDVHLESGEYVESEDLLRFYLNDSFYKEQTKIDISLEGFRETIKENTEDIYETNYNGLWLVPSTRNSWYIRDKNITNPPIPSITGDNNFSIGENNTINGNYGITIGNSLIGEYDQFIIGQYNSPSSDIFIIGNGDDSSTRKNLVYVEREGTINTIGGVNAEQSISTGGNFHVIQDIFSSGNITSDGNTIIKGTLTVKQNTTLEDTLQVYKDITTRETLHSKVIRSTQNIYSGGEMFTGVQPANDTNDLQVVTFKWLKDYYNELSSDISDLDTKITDFKNTINTEINNIKQSISTINSDITTIKGNITTINSTINNVKGDITDIKGDITNIENSIDGLGLEKSDTMPAHSTGTPGDIILNSGNIHNCAGWKKGKSAWGPFGFSPSSVPGSYGSDRRTMVLYGATPNLVCRFKIRGKVMNHYNFVNVPPQQWGQGVNYSIDSSGNESLDVEETVLAAGGGRGGRKYKFNELAFTTGLPKMTVFRVREGLYMCASNIDLSKCFITCSGLKKTDGGPSYVGVRSFLKTGVPSLSDTPNTDENFYAGHEITFVDTENAPSTVFGFTIAAADDTTLNDSAIDVQVWSPYFGGKSSLYNVG